MPVSVIEEPIAPEPPIYREDLEDEFANEEWIYDYPNGIMTYTYRQERSTVKVQVYTVWYKDSVEIDKGVWEGGTEVRREESHYDIYTGVQAIIYTKPIPTPTPAPESTPTATS